MGYAAILIGIGLGGGFVAGLLGLGGSILLVPLLLGIPARLGYEPLPVRAVAAISLVHVAFAAGAAVLLQPQERTRTGAMGMAGPLAALAGGLLSARLLNGTLLFLFALVATAATGLLLVPRRPAPASGRPGVAGPLVAATAGLATGLVGAAGGFLLAPFLQYTLRTPAAKSAALRIALASALAGLVGKGLTGQVDWGLAAALVVGTLPGTWWGGEVSRRLNPRSIRWAALAAALLATLWVWGQVVDLRVFRPSFLYLTALLAGLLVPVWIFARTYQGASVQGPALRAGGRRGGPDPQQPGLRDGGTGRLPGAPPGGGHEPVE